MFKKKKKTKSLYFRINSWGLRYETIVLHLKMRLYLAFSRFLTVKEKSFFFSENFFLS